MTLCCEGKLTDSRCICLCWVSETTPSGADLLGGLNGLRTSPLAVTCSSAGMQSKMSPGEGMGGDVRRKGGPGS